MLIGLSGCGPSGPPRPAGFPDVFSCVITITQEGTPLAGAAVELVPSDGATDWMVRGITDSSGSAKMRTYGLADGAPKGKFKVVVTKTETDESRFSPPADDTDANAWGVYEQNRLRENLRTYTFIEAVFTNANTTTLELEITGNTTEKFDVGKPVRLPIN
jgi:hypothetical protein